MMEAVSWCKLRLPETLCIGLTNKLTNEWLQLRG